MRSYISIALGAVFLLIAMLTLGSFTQDKKKEAHQAPAAQSLTPVTKIPLIPEHVTQAPAAAPGGKLDKDQVCMVNNAYMGKKQVPVPFGNKMYYGCCNMCVKTIKNNREVRFARDPVTGKEVDKALAYIVLKPGSANGDVLYFESEASYKRFKP